MDENTNAAFASTTISKFPSISVKVPVDVPLTWTLATGTGSENLSVTVPFTVILCA